MAFDFVYGPLSLLFIKSLGYRCNITKVFDDSDNEEEYNDSWSSIKLINEKSIEKETHEYEMRFHLSYDVAQKAPVRGKLVMKEIGSKSDAVLDYETRDVLKLSSLNPNQISYLPYVDLIDLELKSERLRSWALNNGWISTTEEDDDYPFKYRFKVVE